MGLFAIQFIYMIILPTRPKPFFLSVIIANTIFLSVNLAYLPKNSFPDYQLITGFIIYTAIVLVTYLIIINYKYSEFIKKAELEDTYRVILRQKEELKNLNDNKNKFFSIIAHDLRNPIGTFHEAVNILSESIEQKDSIHINELISSMKHTSKNLFELLENLLDWSSLQNGSMPFSPAYEPVETIAELTLSMLDQQAKNKNIELKSEIPPNTNAFIDANMIIVVFRNIVSNAIKYTAKGGKVKITSRIVKGNNAFQFNPVKNSFEFVEVKVEDNGIGMHREHIANLFKIDKTTSYPGTNNEKGTGLGLVLCKEIIEKHGGQIRVESLLNEGSVFYFTLPTENFIRV